jgi:hypothetical protein
MRGRYWSLVMVGIALWPTIGQPAAAASFALSEPDRLDAIRTGQKSVVHEEFGAEWRARDAAGQALTVVTPYHRLALAARNAAFKKEPLRPRDVEALLKESEGKLAFWVTLRGARSDFARFMTPSLEAGAEIKASFVQNERTALREDDGRYAARCLYVFPAEGVDPRGRVTLVVRDADERERAKFTVDLSGMR